MSTTAPPTAERRGMLRRIDATGVPALLVRLALGGLFVYMGVVKAESPGNFLKQLHEYQLFPAEWYRVENFIAAVLPWFEIFCGVLLLIGLAVRGTSLLVVLMLVGFTGAVALRAWGIHGQEQIPFCSIKFDCGCGGGEVFICRKLLENAGLTLMGVFLLWSRPDLRWFTVRWLVRPPDNAAANSTSR